MKVCMPVKSDQGAESLVYGHFGSAPYFMVFDSDTSELKAVSNKNEHHEHGQCDPLNSFEDSKPDIVVVGGIGGGALSKLTQAGVRVFKAEGQTVQENITALTTKGLIEFAAQHTCKGHDHGHHEEEHHHHHEHGQGNCACGGHHDHEHHHDHHHEGGCCH